LLRQSKLRFLRPLRRYWIGVSWSTSASKANAWNAPFRSKFTSCPGQSVAPKRFPFKPLQLWWSWYRESVMFRD
jgi:hypothetical protein